MFCTWEEKVRVVVIQDFMTNVDGSVTAPPFQNSGLDGDEKITLGFCSFIRGKEIRYPQSRGLGGLQSWFGRFGDEKHVFL